MDLDGRAAIVTGGGTGVGRATALELARRAGGDAVTLIEAQGWSYADLALGMIPGSMGEVSAVAALLGAIFL